MLVFIATSAFSQSISISTDSSAPDSSAILDVKSTDKGILVPRLTTQQRMNIANPATGLLVYDTDSESFWFHNEMVWINLLAGNTGWSVSGNEANPSDFIGTTNFHSLLFKANNTQAGKIDLDFNNTFWGSEAGEALTIGEDNVGIGSNVLQFTKTGNANTAVGRYSMHNNTTGFRNTAVGNESLFSNTTGSRNIGIGYSALWSNASGASNIAIGMNTLYDNYTGSSNTAVGQNALTYNTIGNGNTALGMDALFQNSTGNNNTAIGHGADVLSDNLSNATAIGFNAKVDCSNCLILGGTTTNAVDVGIGNVKPAASLDITGPPAPPAIPGMTSNGILRIGLNTLEGIDIGKMIDAPHSGWIQVGVGGVLADPLSLQPVSGNVGIGTISPANKLSVVGKVNITGSVGVGVTTPNATAKLELNSTSQGFLPPRMSSAQRDSIDNPAHGLIIYCLDCNGGVGELQVRHSYYWTSLVGGPPPDTTLNVGDPFEGGILAYVYQPGDPGYVEGEFHGLVTTTLEIAFTIWGCDGESIPGADGIVLGTGAQNTTDIVNGCEETSIAVRACLDYVSGGYDDWFFPSKDEMLKVAGAMVVIGQYHVSNYYPSSSEVDSDHAWALHGGGLVLLDKSMLVEIRPIRYF